MLKLFAAALLAIPALSAQVVTAENCVHQAGDNPDWARPDFDDRLWSKNYNYRRGNPYVWTRCRMELSALPRLTPIQIGVDSLTAWELFVDGVPAGSFGDIRTGFSGSTYEQRPIPSEVATRTHITVALRQLPGRNPRARDRPYVAAGSKDALIDRHAAEVLEALWRQSPALLGGGFIFLIGVVLLLLYSFSGDGTQRELLWFGIYCLAYSSLRFRDVLDVSSANVPAWLAIVWHSLGNVLVLYSMPRIFFALAGRRLPAFYSWLAMALTGWIVCVTGLVLLAPIDLAQLPQEVGSAENPFRLLLATAAVAAFWPLWQVPRHLRVACSVSILFLLGYAARQVPQLPGIGLGYWLSVGSNWQAVFYLSALIGIFVVIAQRHRRVSLDRAELQGEMKAAQEVQQLLTSSTLDVAPWAAVEVAYLPSKEVGGDFYFCRQTPEGQLVVVGDVSGKGLRAAMLASVALGALRSIDTSSPAQLLQRLNQSIHGQTGGGFVTCCAALLRKDGQWIVANAGHPSPYAAGHELALEAGLPLGIVAEATYEESTCQGDRITLVSDGVVEAENQNRELFGFDRTREISTKSAQEIAAAAKAWGQNDDITVVTVTRKSA